MRLILSTLLIISALCCALFCSSVAHGQTASVRPMEFAYRPANDMLYYDYRGNKDQFELLSDIISSKRDSIKQGLLKFHIRGFIPAADNSDAQLKLLRTRSSRLKSYMIQRFGIKEAEFYSSNPTLPNVSELSADNSMINIVELSLLPTGAVPFTSSHTTTRYTPLTELPPATFTSLSTTTDIHRNIAPLNKPSMLPPPTGGPEEYVPKTTSEAQPPAKPEDAPVPEPSRKPFSNDLRPPSFDLNAPYPVKESAKKQKTATVQDIYETYYTQPETKSSPDVVHPTWSVGTNLLYWLALSPNIEFQVMMGRHFSFSLEAQYSYLLMDAGHKRYHTWSVAPEFRYWFSRGTFTGSSLGIYAAIGEFDLKFGDTGHQGGFAQAGISYNYTLKLRPRTALRFGLSAGYVRTKGATYDSFQLPVYTFVGDEYMQYIGITRAGISIVFQLGNKKGGTQ